MPAAVKSSSHPVTISEKDRKINLLKSLVQNRVLLAIDAIVFDVTVSSTILEVDLNGDSFLLDEFVPRTANQFLAEGTRLSMSCKLYGVPMHFYTKILETGQQNSINFYRCQIPETLDYHQNRTDYRLRNKDSDKPSFQFIGHKHQAPGNVVDISLGGISVLFDARPADFTEGEPLGIEITFDETTLITTDAIVKHIGENKRENSVRVGLGFVNLDSRAQRLVGQWIKNNERKRLRRRNRRDQQVYHRKK